MKNNVGSLDGETAFLSLHRVSEIGSKPTRAAIQGTLRLTKERSATSCDPELEKMQNMRDVFNDMLYANVV
jgi:hypothetical protein